MEDFFEISKAKNKNYKKGRPPPEKKSTKNENPKTSPPPGKKNYLPFFKILIRRKRGLQSAQNYIFMFIYLISCNCLINSIPLFVNLTKNVCWQKRGLPSSVSAHLMIRAFCWQNEDQHSVRLVHTRKDMVTAMFFSF